jgi:hypothetical protein
MSELSGGWRCEDEKRRIEQTKKKRKKVRRRKIDWVASRALWAFGQKWAWP